ncbi:MAG: adenylate/guanylate cyclase domain-containing protein [Ignavibacteria bacterium]|nr:adenylate/guanylate cyclase domain-containing protein [Ignavibacteria bacterium]MBT8381872.1 adenylate/guanylate cyclase domain-containing protein [Ignavibacteria bacterium]NNL21836.1 adenylate/guanylate cyclase domain-containing protein [Ignavibacteriaceae bacterium]
MDRKAKIIFKEWLFIILGWITITYLYYLVSVWGIRQLMKDNVITEYLDTGYAHLEIILLGLVFGTLFSFINSFLDRTKIGKKSFGAVIIIKSGLYLLAFLIAGLVIYFVYNVFEILTEVQWQESVGILTTQYIISAAVYFSLAIVFMNFIIQVNRKFGRGNLLKLLFGKYHSPKDEEHIFMFMDLQGSTAIAERLGHNKYSQLMQNCFHDLTDIVIKYQASIYQYVGDEVVLNWDMKTGLKNLNCIKSYFAFERKLKSKEKFYMKNFETAPFFKCGVDCGEVTVAEIGEIKREIAYHGDVLNTAARIEKKCTPLNKKMIISEYLEKELPENIDGFSKEPIGEIALKGKKGKIILFSIEYRN